MYVGHTGYNSCQIASFLHIKIHRQADFFKNANYIPLLKDFYLISNQNRASHNLIVQNMNKPK